MRSEYKGQPAGGRAPIVMTGRLGLREWAGLLLACCILALGACDSLARSQRLSEGGTELIRITATGFQGELDSTWERLEGMDGSVSPVVLRALPSGPSDHPAEPLTYQVDFVVPGVYYVWVRGRASEPGGATVSLSLAMGDEVGPRMNVRLPIDDAWTVANGDGDGQHHEVRVVSSGRHPLHVWPKSAGFILDEILLSRDPGFVPQPSSMAVLWQTDHESGDLLDWERATGWRVCGGDFSSGGASIGITDEVARSGAYSMELRIEDVDGDQGARMFRGRCEAEGRQGLYYSAWLYFPRAYVTEAGWWNVWQWKSQGPEDDESRVQWVLDVRGDGRSMYFRLRDKVGEGTRWYDQTSPLPIPLREWVHIEAFYRPDAEAGTVIAWQDGREIFRFSHLPTKRPGGNTYWSVNNYTSGIRPDPATIYVDDAAISTQRLGPRYPPLPE